MGGDEDIQLGSEETDRRCPCPLSRGLPVPPHYADRQAGGGDSVSPRRDRVNNKEENRADAVFAERLPHNKCCDDCVEQNGASPDSFDDDRLARARGTGCLCFFTHRMSV